MSAPFTLDAPGRLCLFGEHQDYLGLEVIACGIDRRMRIVGAPDPGRSDLLLELPDLGSTLTLDPADRSPYRDSRDYLRSCLRVLDKEGVKVPGGWRFRLTSTIPVGAGCGSSSVLCVVWLAALLRAAGKPERYTPREVARLANRAEVEEFGESGGIMDHLAAALGGMIHLDCREPYTVRDCAARPEGLVLIHPGEPKETTEVIRQVRERAQQALAEACRLRPGFDLREAAVGDGLQLALELELPLQQVLRSHLENRALFRTMLPGIAAGTHDPLALGRALTDLQSTLSADLGISTEGIDRALDVACAAGALGGKLNGSGGGGTCFVLAPGRETEVISALKDIDVQAWAVEVAPGLRLVG